MNAPKNADPESAARAWALERVRRCISALTPIDSGHGPAIRPTGTSLGHVRLALDEPRAVPQAPLGEVDAADLYLAVDIGPGSGPPAELRRHPPGLIDPYLFRCPFVHDIGARAELIGKAVQVRCTPDAVYGVRRHDHDVLGEDGSDSTCVMLGDGSVRRCAA